MTNSKIARNRFRRILLTLTSIVIACGDDSQQQAESSSEPRASMTQSSPDLNVANRPPTITSIRFEPARAMPGKQLRVRVATTDLDRDPVKLGHTWKINGRPAASSNSILEIPSNLRKGDRIEVSVIASDGKANSGPAVQTILIGNSRPTIQEIQIHVRGDENGQMGQWIADPIAMDPDGDKLTFRYSWIVNGRRIDGQGGELARAPRKRGDEIELVVWAMDGESESAPLRSAPFRIGNSAPDINSRPPPMDPSGQFVYAVSASDRDGDRGLRYTLRQGPEGMKIDAFSGELRWHAELRHAGEHIVEIAVDDRHGGVTTQTFYVHVATGPASQQ